MYIALKLGKYAQVPWPSNCGALKILSNVYRPCIQASFAKYRLPQWISKRSKCKLPQRYSGLSNFRSIQDCGIFTGRGLGKCSLCQTLYCLVFFSAARYISSGDSHWHGCVARSPGSHCRNVPICEDDFTAATREYFLTMDGHVSRQKKIHMCIHLMAKYIQMDQKNELEHAYIIRLDDTIGTLQLTFRKVRWVHWH